MTRGTDRFFYASGVLVLIGILGFGIAGALVVCVPSVRKAFGFEARLEHAYVPGQRVDVPENALQGPEATLVLMTREDCAACQKAKPVLKRLVQQAQLNEVGTLLVAPTWSDSTEEAQFAADIDVPPRKVLQMAVSSYRVKTVPTLLLVERTGMIRFVVEGIPKAADETALANLMSRTSAR